MQCSHESKRNVPHSAYKKDRAVPDVKRDRPFEVKRCKMKIAVTGKGGVGKTTIAATLARLYAEEGHPVLAADVDPDANLGLALDFRKKSSIRSFRLPK